MYISKNWLNWIVDIAFKTIRCRFIFVASFPAGCVVCCLDFQTKNISFRPHQARNGNTLFISSILDFQTTNISFRPYQAKNRNILFILFITWLFKTLKTINPLGTWRTLEALGYFKALGHLRNLGPLHFRHLETWALEALEALESLEGTWFNRLKTLGNKSITFIIWKIHQAVQTWTFF